MIFVALAIIPIHIEQIAVLYFEQQRMVDYSDTTSKHVVLCTTELRFDAILDFLNEFYEVDDHQENYSVVILCPNEPPSLLKRFLQAPLWQSRVTTILGTTYRDEDLQRAKGSGFEFFIGKMKNSVFSTVRNFIIGNFEIRPAILILFENFSEFSKNRALSYGSKKFSKKNQNCRSYFKVP